MNNVYLLRFHILKEYYDELMYTENHNTSIKELVANIQAEGDYPEITVRKNMAYLATTGYLNQDGNNNFGLSYKGIKLVEDITKGDLEFTIPSKKEEKERKIDSIGYFFQMYDPNIAVESSS